MSARDLEGKVIVITGATTGIGEATAVEFAKYGSRLVLCGRNLEGLQDTKAQCVSQGLDQHHVAIVTGDIRHDSTLDDIVKTTLDAFGKADVLFLNAGKGNPSDGPVHLAPDSVNALDHYYEIFVKSPYKLTQKLSAELIKSKGVIVLTSTALSGEIVQPLMTCYSIMKAAVDQMTRLFALTFANKGVRVNAISPGFCFTNFGSELGFPIDAFGDSFSKTTPLGGHTITPAEIARVVVFLASEQSACMTGTILSTNRGNSLTHPAVDWKQF